MAIAGDRYATISGGTGWIVDKPTNNPELALTKLTLTDGNLTTNLIGTAIPAASWIEGVADDGAGHLWLTSDVTVLEIDEQTGVVRIWPLPEKPFNRVNADAWDPRTNGLLFVGGDNHRLFQLDPGSGRVTTIADLPLLTSDDSHVVVADDGSIGITGDRLGAKDFTPTAGSCRSVVAPPVCCRTCSRSAPGPPA